MFPAGREFAHPVSSIDIFPTVAALTGIAPPADLDGVNLTPFLAHQKPTAPHDALFFAINGLGAVRSDRWKLVLVPDLAPQLYDLERDPSESSDLAAKFPDRVQSLHRQWQAWSAPLPVQPRPAQGKGKK
jgi:arylsulfatase A-like enzyme